MAGNGQYAARGGKAPAGNAALVTPGPQAESSPPPGGAGQPKGNPWLLYPKLTADEEWSILALLKLHYQWLTTNADFLVLSKTASPGMMSDSLTKTLSLMIDLQKLNAGGGSMTLDDFLAGIAAARGAGPGIESDDTAEVTP